eukprot:g2166.t1
MWVHRDCSPKEGETCDGGEEANGRQVSALVSTVEMEDLSTDKVYEVSHIEAMEMASGVRYDRTGLRKTYLTIMCAPPESVRCLELGQEFPSNNAAAEALGVIRGNIRRSLQTGAPVPQVGYHFYETCYF